MPIPGLTSSILDNGLGLSTPATSRACVIGPAVDGVVAVAVPTLIANQRQLKDNFGTVGQLVDEAGAILDQSGGPILCVRTTATVVGTYNAGTTLTVASSISPGASNGIDFAIATSTPKDDYDVQIRITTGGLVAATKFQYSLDGGKTFSEILQAAASVALGNSGITAAFQTGVTNFVAGATYGVLTPITARAAYVDATGLGAALDALLASPLTFDFIAIAGQAATAAAAATLLSTLATKLASFVTADRYYRAVMSAGYGTAALAITAFTSVVNARVAVVYGRSRQVPAFQVSGFNLPFMSNAHLAAVRAAGNVVSTDLAKTAGNASVGPLPAYELEANEYLTATGLDDIKVGTTRTYPNLDGFFFTNVWLKSAAGSDFAYWQHGRMMDLACAIVSAEHAKLLHSGVACKADGTGQIQEFAAQQIEKTVQRQLDNRLGSAIRGIGPVTVDGSVGHVSEVRYTVDRTNNLLSTQTLIATVSIVPRGYVKFINTTLSYKLSV